MRSVILASMLASCLALGTLPAMADDGVPHLNQVTLSQLSQVASGTTPLEQVTITYAYQNQWGVKETWQIQGTTLYVWKSVYTAAYHDQARALLAGGHSLSDLQSSIFELPYGDYDQYFRATLTPAQVRAVAQSFATHRLPDAPARVGCGEKHWEIALQINGQRTHIFDVNAPGNPILAACIDPLQDLFSSVDGSLQPINQQEFATAFVDLTSASLQGS